LTVHATSDLLGMLYKFLLTCHKLLFEYVCVELLNYDLLRTRTHIATLKFTVCCFERFLIGQEVHEEELVS
jgi:hypothetical protein